MKKRLLSLACAACALAVPATTLEEDFRSPPRDAKPLAWWDWLGNNVSAAGIVKDMKSLADAGVGGVTFFYAGSHTGMEVLLNEYSPDVKFRNGKWWALLRLAVEEAKKNGLEFGLHNCPGWSVSGGPWVTPERSMKTVVWSVAKKGEKPAQPASKLGFYRDIATVDFGEKTYRFGYTTTAMRPKPAPDDIRERSLEVDKLDADAVRFHMDNALRPLKEHLGDLVGTTVTHILMDSYEAGECNWTDRMREEFAKRRGYDPVPFLPALAGEEMKDGDKFRRDLGKTVADLFTDCHYRVIAEECHKYGLTFNLEPYTGPFNSYEAAAICDVPMVEFWSARTHWMGPDEIGCPSGFAGGVARAYGRRIVGAEAFTGMPNCSSFCTSPRDLKRAADRVFARGVNRLSLHSWVHQPFPDRYRPGMTFGWWGTQFGRHQTWYPYIRDFTAYLARVQAMLQRGEAVVDTLAVEQMPTATEFDAIPKSALRDVKRDGDDYVLPSGRRYRRLLQKREPFVSPWPKDFCVQHRREGAVDWYFVANAGAATNVVLALDSVGRIPEVWNPDDGSIAPAAKWSARDGKTLVTDGFDAVGSKFYVFRTPTDRTASEPSAEPAAFDTAELGGAWGVRFPDDCGIPKGEHILVGLKSLSEVPMDGIRHFSGTATYRKVTSGSFANRKQIEQAKKVLLDLGDVREIAEVTVNGKSFGAKWHPPFVWDVTGALWGGGNNEIVVKVTNNWANRMIGDHQEEEDCEWNKPQDWHRYEFVPNQYAGRGIRVIPDFVINDTDRPSKNRRTFCVWDFFGVDSPLYPAGLIGPVKVTFLK